MILYHGPNWHNTDKIVVIATGMGRASANRKTGDMIQIWILNADLLPTEACKMGRDDSVCGDCPLRPTNGGGCYVNVGQAPNSIYRKFKKGGYSEWDGTKFAKPVRIGAYGDIAAIPGPIVDKIIGACEEGRTCYTHMWQYRDDLKHIAMASVETEQEYIIASNQGWSTFRIRPKDGEYMANEMVCLNEYRNLQCTDCKLCNGNDSSQKAITITAHGSQARKVHNV